MIELDAELVLEAHAALAEGPVWDAARGVLWWVDITPGHVHAFDPATGNDTRYEIGSPVGAVALRGDGRLLVAARDSFVTLDPETGSLETTLAMPTEDPARRANDGKCDPRGRLLVGRMALDGSEGAGGLYRLDPGPSLALLIDGLTIPNGLAWRSDGREMYFVDSARPEVRAYAYDPVSGAVGAGHRLVALAGDGVPDGMTIDTDDCLWVAVWGGSAVLRISPAGDVLATVRLPVSQPSSCTFGGPHLDELYITTAREGLSSDERARQPLAGCLFAARPGQTGYPPVQVAG